jgi:hypothetical protein
MEHVTGTDAPIGRTPSEDRLFHELDNRRIGIGSESWVAQVFGIHLIGEEGWLQIASREEPWRSVVVHVRPETTAGHVALALARWAECTADDRPFLIDAPRISGH